MNETDKRTIQEANYELSERCDQMYEEMIWDLSNKLHIDEDEIRDVLEGRNDEDD